MKDISCAVDWNIIQSDAYSERFTALSNDKKVSSAIETRAKWALNNRDGADTEEIYAISLFDGHEVGRITNQHIKSAVRRTEKFTRELDAADSSGEKVLLLHNHPKGLPPSISDINALYRNKNVAGITVGHNGSIYRRGSRISGWHYVSSDFKFLVWSGAMDTVSDVCMGNDRTCRRTSLKVSEKK